MNKPLTPADVMALHSIVDAVSRGNSTIARLIDDVRFDGTVRSFAANADGTGAVFGTDVRDNFLVVDTGVTQLVWPVQHVVTALQAGEAMIRHGGDGPAEPPVYRVHIIGPNLPDQRLGSFHVHAQGCADVTRNRDYRSAAFAFDRENVAIVSTLDDIVHYAYADQISEGSMTVEEGRDDFYLFPCVVGIG